MIKIIDEKDLSRCLSVIHNSFITVAIEFGLTKDNCPTNGAFMPFSRLERDYVRGDIMFAAYEGDEMIGFAQLSKKDEGVFELEKLAVLPEWRHKGCGRALIEFARHQVKALGGSKITIGIIEENKRVKDWYLLNGFVHTGTRVFPHLPFTVGFMETRINP